MTSISVIVKSIQYRPDIEQTFCVSAWLPQPFLLSVCAAEAGMAIFIEYLSGAVPIPGAGEETVNKADRCRALFLVRASGKKAVNERDISGSVKCCGDKQRQGMVRKEAQFRHDG